MTSTNPFDEIGHIDAIVKQFKILTDNTMKLIRNTNTNKSKPLQLPVDINDVNDVDVELLKFKVFNSEYEHKQEQTVATAGWYKRCKRGAVKV